MTLTMRCMDSTCKPVQLFHCHLNSLFVQSDSRMAAPREDLRWHQTSLGLPRVFLLNYMISDGLWQMRMCLAHRSAALAKRWRPIHLRIIVRARQSCDALTCLYSGLLDRSCSIALVYALDTQLEGMLFLSFDLPFFGLVALKYPAKALNLQASQGKPLCASALQGLYSMNNTFPLGEGGVCNKRGPCYFSADLQFCLKASRS